MEAMPTGEKADGSIFLLSQVVESVQAYGAVAYSIAEARRKELKRTLFQLLLLLSSRFRELAGK
jgi:hypothetical protein